MSKRYLTLIAVTAFSLSTVNAEAQTYNDAATNNRLFSQDYHYNWDFTGAGARGMALAGAYTALSDEPLGLSWNPAGVAGFEEIYVAFDWSSFNPSGSYEFNSGAFSNSHNGGTSNFFRNGAITAPLTVKNQKLTLGLALSRAFDTYNLFTDKVFPHPTSPLTQDVSYERGGHLNIAHLGGGTAISETISFGATANIHFGKVVVDQQRTEIYRNLLTGLTGTQPARVQRDIQQIDSFNISGLNFTLGTIVNVTEETRVGLSLRTPFKIKMSDDASLYEVIFINDVIAPGELGDTIIAPDRNSQVEMPLIINLGIAHTWSESFMSSFDISYRGFSGTNFLVFDSTNISPQGNQEIFRHDVATDWSNAIQLRLGGEYSMDSDYGLLQLRGGVGYLQQPYRDVSDYWYQFSSYTFPVSVIAPVMPVPTQTFIGGEQIFAGSGTEFEFNKDMDRTLVSQGDQVASMSFSLGFGLKTDQRKIDFAYSYTGSTQMFTTNQALELSPYDVTSADNPNDPAHHNRVLRTSESKIKDHRFMVSFTGYF